jgi:hypothetical protein
MSVLTLPALAPSRRLAVQRKRLGWCLAVVVCAHSLLLLQPQRQAAQSPAGDASRAVRVRLIAPGSPLGSPPPATTPTAVPTATTGAVPQSHQPMPAALAPAVPKPDPPATSRVPAGRDDGEYLTRSALTAAPKAQGPVAIDYPYFDGEADHYVGEFDVFIDDSGSVVRVVSATPDLPLLLSSAVRDAFLAARFTPGEVDGLTVRSRIRIEVTFDSRKQPAL